MKNLQADCPEILIMANMDGHMKIRKTTDKDLKRVMEIYAYARKFMAEHGNPNQWGKKKLAYEKTH
ncbi:MAG: hypothetical protein IJU77_06785 [Butyrivibrio sp.]|nr:hypothetical protein [Butyrivibrio sp.]